MEGCGRRKVQIWEHEADRGGSQTKEKTREREMADLKGMGKCPIGDLICIYTEQSICICICICISKAKAGALQSEILLKWDGDGLKSFYGSTYLSLYLSSYSILSFSIIHTYTPGRPQPKAPTSRPLSRSLISNFV